MESLGIFPFLLFHLLQKMCFCPEHAYTCLIFITSLFLQDFHDLFSYIKNSFSFSVEKNQSHKGSHEKLYMKKFANLKQKSIPVMYQFRFAMVSAAQMKNMLFVFTKIYIPYYVYTIIYIYIKITEQ